MKPHTTIALLAGEASGDLLGAGLMASLKSLFPNSVFEGIGGTLMQAQGFTSLHDMERLSVMGFVEPLKRLPELLRIRRDVTRHFLAHPPDVFIGIDSPDFNLGVEAALRQAGIPVVHYVSPSVWAWRQKRIHRIVQSVDHVLTLFPFEKAFYDQHALPATFVGHPLADTIPLQSDRQAARQVLDLPLSTPCLALLPGSREGELRHMVPLFLAAAREVRRKIPDLRIVSAASSDIRRQQLEVLCAQHAPDLEIRIDSRPQAVMTAADGVLVTSGTATLETLLCGTPMVIAFKMSALLFPLVRRMVKVPFAGLPNLLAGRALVPEFIQQAATPAALSAGVLGFLLHPERVEALRADFQKIHLSLRKNASETAAQVVRSLVPQGK